MCISNNGNGIIYVERKKKREIPQSEGPRCIGTGCGAWVYLAPVLNPDLSGAGRHVRRSYYNQSEIRYEF